MRLHFFHLFSLYYRKKSNRNSLYYNIIHKLSDYILIDATRKDISFKTRIKVYRNGAGSTVLRMLSFRSVVCLSSVFIVIIIIFSVVRISLKYTRSIIILCFFFIFIFYYNTRIMCITKHKLLLGVKNI